MGEEMQGGKRSMEEVRLDGAIWLLKSGLLFLDGDRIRLLEESPELEDAR